MRHPHPSRRRPGTVLVWFAVLVWVLFAIAALTIDLGLVRVTQRQMQSLTDMAAVEAVWAPDQSPKGRRNAAQGMIDLAQNDTQTNDPDRFGAGPLIDFSGGVPVGDGFSAAQTLTIPNPRTYHPTLAINASNVVDGDIVQGTYSSAQTTANPEQSGYTRPDFTPSMQGDAILVRLRRSNEQFAANDPSRSNGPPLPYLFARGTVMAAQNKGQGATVRATSIAAARPALMAGPTGQGIPGVTPFGLLLSSTDPAILTWQSWRQQNPNGATLTAKVNMSTGTIGGTVTGAFTAPVTVVTTLGQTFTPVSQPPSSPQQLDRYVPLYDTNSRIVGFLHAYDPIMNTGPTLAQDGTLTVPISLAVASANASTALANTTPNPLAALTSAQLSSLFSSNASITDPLRVPALVR